MALSESKSGHTVTEFSFTDFTQTAALSLTRHVRGCLSEGYGSSEHHLDDNISLSGGYSLFPVCSLTQIVDICC